MDSTNNRRHDNADEGHDCFHPSGSLALRLPLLQMNPWMPMAGDFASRIGRRSRASAPTMHMAPTVHMMPTTHMAWFRQSGSLVSPHRRRKAVTSAGRTIEREIWSEPFAIGKAPGAQPGAFSKSTQCGC